MFEGLKYVIVGMAIGMALGIAIGFGSDSDSDCVTVHIKN